MRSGDTIDPALDSLALETFNTAIRVIGGPGMLAQRKEFSLLPALMEAAYAVVLAEEGHRASDEIADLLHTTKGAVESVLEAPTEAAVPRIRYAGNELPEFELHSDPEWSGTPKIGHQEPAYLVGALAKFAYAVVKRSQVQPAHGSAGPVGAQASPEAGAP